MSVKLNSKPNEPVWTSEMRRFLLTDKFARAVEQKGLDALPERLVSAIRRFAGEELDAEVMNKNRLFAEGLPARRFSFCSSRKLYQIFADKHESDTEISRLRRDNWLARSEEALANEFALSLVSEDQTTKQYSAKSAWLDRILLLPEFNMVFAEPAARTKEQKAQEKKEWKEQAAQRSARWKKADLFNTGTALEDLLDYAKLPSNSRRRKYRENDTHLAVFMMREQDIETGKKRIAETHCRVSREEGLQKAYDDLVIDQLSDPRSELLEVRIAELIEIGDQPRRVEPDAYDHRHATREELDKKYPGIEKRPLGVCLIPAVQPV